MRGKRFAAALAAITALLALASQANAEVMQFDCQITGDIQKTTIARLWIDTQKPNVTTQSMSPDGKGMPIVDVRPSTVQVSPTSIRWTYKPVNQTNSLDLKTGVWLETFLSGRPNSFTESFTCVKGGEPFPTPVETNANTTNSLSASVGAQASPAPHASMAGGQANAEVTELDCAFDDGQVFMNVWVDFAKSTVTQQSRAYGGLQTIPAQITSTSISWRYEYTPSAFDTYSIDRVSGDMQRGKTGPGIVTMGAAPVHCAKGTTPLPATKF